jgi:hypothetical protein
MGLANQGVTPGRTTLLDGVNTLLTNIGEQPVDSLERQQVHDAWIAESTLLEFHREGQLRGWSWNREEAYPFERDAVTKEVVVPSNVISFAVNQYQWDGRFIVRGQRVYDLWQRSYKIEDGIAPIHADVVWLLPWDDSPEAFNRWTVIRSARVFATRVLGSDSTIRYTALDEQAALTELMRTELAQAQPNSLTGGPGLRPFPTYQPGWGLMRGVNGGQIIG